LKKTAVFLSIFTIIAIGLILTGWFDPHPYGELAWERQLSAITIPARSEQVVWVDEGVEGAYSVRLTAVFTNGNPDSRYGLLLDDLRITISPTGYAAIERGDQVIVPYAPFPHVHRDKVNEIWIDVGAGDGSLRSVTARLNRELFWQGDVAFSAKNIGVIAENFGDSEAVIAFQTLSFFD